MPGDKGGKTKHDRCVEHVKQNSPEVNNPHAVCVAQGVRPSSWKKSKKEDYFELIKFYPNGQWSIRKADECHEDDPKHEAKEIEAARKQKKLAEQQEKLAEKVLDVHKK